MLAALIQREDGLELVGVAADADEAVAAGRPAPSRRGRAGLRHAARGGVRAAVDIREALPGVRIVALSADESAAAQLDMSRAGAVGYLVKGTADDEILRVIRSAFRW